MQDLQQQHYQERRRGSRSETATPWNTADSPLSGSTADSASSSSCYYSTEQLQEIRGRVAANLDAAEEILSSLRSPSGAYTHPGAATAAAVADRAQSRHFADLLMAAREELATVGASLDASIERRALLGDIEASDRKRRKDRDAEGSALLQGEDAEGEADAAALGKERRGLLYANTSIQQMIDSGFAALQQLRGQRQRQQQQQILLRMLGSGVSGVRTLITNVHRVRRRDKVVLGLVLGFLLVFTFLWLTKLKPNG